MSWSDQYIGVPHALHGTDRHGCDCWGLVRLVFLVQHNIDLPSYQGASTSRAEIAEMHRLVAGERDSGPWQPVEGEYLPFDVLVFRRGRFNAHVAIVVDNRLMLHIAEDDCARLENYQVSRWASRRTGAYRHGEVVS
jgi:cell wall-associated NlpC family hydrolase